MTHRIQVVQFVLGAGAVVALLLAMPGAAAAQEEAPELFGPGVSYLYVPAEDFTCSEPGDVEGCQYSSGVYGWWYSHNTNGQTVYASLDLPAGALILGYRLLYEDNDSSGWVALSFWRYWYHSGSRGEYLINGFSSGVSGTPGVADQWIDVDPDVTVRYRYRVFLETYYQKYIMKVELHGGTADTSFSGILVSWQRQVSPEPLSATFADVPPEHPFFPFVEALVASGITAGCGGGNYCPDDPITRGQMAVFLSSALGLHWP